MDLTSLHPLPPSAGLCLCEHVFSPSPVFQGNPRGGVGGEGSGTSACRAASTSLGSRNVLERCNGWMAECMGGWMFTSSSCYRLHSSEQKCEQKPRFQKTLRHT